MAINHHLPADYAARLNAVPMKPRKRPAIEILRVDEFHYNLTVGGLVRYSGSFEECIRRSKLLVPNNDREKQDQALYSVCSR